jgi:hypothetical protein
VIGASRPFAARFRTKCALCGVWAEIGALLVFVPQAPRPVHKECAEKLLRCEQQR